MTVLFGCAVGQPVDIETTDPQLVVQPDDVTVRLADAADRAARALDVLASIEQNRTPEAKLAPITSAPRELRRTVTLSWVGPIGPVTQKMADRAGYQFKVIGREPPVPIIVNIQAENAPVVEVLRNIGLQAGRRADIAVDAVSKTVEVRYAAQTL